MRVASVPVDGVPRRWGVAASAAAGLFVLASIPALLAWSEPWRGLEDYVRGAEDTHLVPYALWWLVSLSFLVAMAALVVVAPDRWPALLALVLAVPYATLASVNYVLQLTFVRNAVRAGETEGLATWIVGNPSSPLFAIDILGYLFLTLATLAAAFAFNPRMRGGRALRTLYLTHGVVGSLGFFTLFLPPRTWEGDSVAGTLILAAWPLLFGPMMLLTARWFAGSAASRG